MANLKDISRQIKSVKNTQKTTKAMKLVSSAKLIRARQLSDQAKSYALKIDDILIDISARVNHISAENEELSRAFRTVTDIKTVDIVFVTADKGLCGGFNMTTIKAVRNLIEEYSSKGITVRLKAVGRKGIDYFNFQGVELAEQIIGLSAAPKYQNASEFIHKTFEEFNNEETDKVILVYNGFLNMLAQELKVKNILPIDANSLEGVTITSAIEIEPEDNEEEILDELASKYVEFNMYYALIDSLAAEHSARMQSMDSATKNAKEKVDSLTVEFNKARQAAITTELIEIISGVEALK